MTLVRRSALSGPDRTKGMGWPEGKISPSNSWPHKRTPTLAGAFATLSHALLRAGYFFSSVAFGRRLTLAVGRGLEASLMCANAVLKTPNALPRPFITSGFGARQ